MDGDERAEGSLAALDLLAEERLGDEVEAGAAVLLRDHDAEQAELGHALDRVHVETVVDVVLDRVRQHALVDERAHRVLDEALLLGKLEVHGGSLWKRLGRLPVEIQTVGLERLSRRCRGVHPRVDRRLDLGQRRRRPRRGRHVHRRGPRRFPLPVPREGHFGELCELVGGTDLFAAEPAMPSRQYRRWAFESALLDLALRQHGLVRGRGRARAAAGALRRLDAARRAVVGRPAAAAAELYPGLRFKLDPTIDWDEALVTTLAATGAIDTVDLKGFYRGTAVDTPADPVLYGRVAEHFPDAWIEDPGLTDETGPVLEPFRERITWDAPIHSVADVEALPFAPRCLNVKPSRFGSLQELLRFYAYCAEREIRLYGGGQFELGVGRGHIQYLASLFHPDSPNDVAPRRVQRAGAAARAAEQPAPPRAPEDRGFRWREPGATL